VKEGANVVFLDQPINHVFTSDRYGKLDFLSCNCIDYIIFLVCHDWLFYWGRPRCSDIKHDARPQAIEAVVGSCC